jgi:hypothetical protein
MTSLCSENVIGMSVLFNNSLFGRSDNKTEFSSFWSDNTESVTAAGSGYFCKSNILVMSQQYHHVYNFIREFLSNHFQDNYEMGIISTLAGIDICDVQKWGGLTNMLSDDYLLNQTISVFSGFQEVSEMFYLNKGNRLDIFVLLDNESYDSELMRSLIETEDLVRDMWKSKEVEVNYAPIKHIDKASLLKHYKIAYIKG